jgi:hypothetical protein
MDFRDNSKGAILCKQAGWMISGAVTAWWRWQQQQVMQVVLSAHLNSQQHAAPTDHQT